MKDRADWTLEFVGYVPEKEGLRESLCALGNGYFATRAACPDARADEVHYPGTYIAGGYDRAWSVVEGREVENEDLVNLPNWLPLTFRVDGGPWFHIDDVELLDYRQTLDLREGVLHRDYTFRDEKGRTTRVRERRFVSMADMHVAGLEVELTAKDWSGNLEVRSGIDGGVVNAGVARYRALEGRHIDVIERAALEGGDAIFLRCRTRQSLIQIAMAARTRLMRDGKLVDADEETILTHDRVDQEIDVKVDVGTTLTVEKIVVLYTSRDVAISEAGLEARTRIRALPGFEALLHAHRRAWRHLWDDFDIELCEPASPDTEKKLRVHIYHLLQTASHHSFDLDVGMPARGWNGEAYRGHIFWDELFIFPFFSLRMPTLTRALLRYRYRRLDK
ncbi:MAG: glycoside hydrolase family 65 protein, partial [Myxococcales bacterium]|nr:glycoside hydrolase family 65 protein [Myxococcales bacterium]